MSVTKTTTTIKYKANGTTASIPYLVVAHYIDSTDPSKHAFMAYIFSYRMDSSITGNVSNYVPSSFSTVTLSSGGTQYASVTLGNTVTRSAASSSLTTTYYIFTSSSNISVGTASSGNIPSVTFPSEPDSWITLSPGTYTYSPTQTCVAQGTTWTTTPSTSTFSVTLPVHVTSGTFSWKNSISYAITDYDSSYSYKLYFAAGSTSNTYNRKLITSSPSSSGTYSLTVADVVEAWAATSATEKNAALSSSKTCYLMALAYNSSNVQVGSAYASLGSVSLPNGVFITPQDATVGSASSYTVGISATDTAPIGSLGAGTAKPFVYFYQSNTIDSSRYYNNLNLSFTVTSTSQSATFTWTPDAETVGSIITQDLSGNMYGYIYWRFEVDGTAYHWESSKWSEKKTITLPESIYAPTPSIDSITDSEGFYDTYGFGVTGLSKLTCIGSATYKYSATEASAGFTFDGSSYSGSEITTNVCSSSGTKSLVYSVTDSRGITRSATVSISVILWHAPSLTNISVRRGYYSGGVWTQDDDGDYFKLDYTANVSAVNNTNEYTIKITLPESTQTNTYTSDYTATRTVYGHADTESSYTIYFVTTDKYASTSQQYVLSTAGVVLDILSGGKGIGLGKVAEQSKYVDVNSEWTFRAYNIMVGEQTLEDYIKSIISETSGS